MSLRPSKEWQRWIFAYRGLALALLGVWTWLQAKPTPSSVVLGLILGVAGEAFRIWAIGYTGQITRSLKPDVVQLVTAGPYSLVRNPLYFGNILNAVGVLVAGSGAMNRGELLHLWGVGLAGLTVLYSSLISVEEEFLSQKFGQEYWSYYRRVPALCPRTLVCSPGNGTFSWRHGVRWELTTLWWWLFTWVLLAWMSRHHISWHLLRS